jgi:hypothetical protein
LILYKTTQNQQVTLQCDKVEIGVPVFDIKDTRGKTCRQSIVKPALQVISAVRNDMPVHISGFSFLPAGSTLCHEPSHCQAILVCMRHPLFNRRTARPMKKGSKSPGKIALFLFDIVVRLAKAAAMSRPSRFICLGACPRIAIFSQIEAF